MLRLAVARLPASAASRVAPAWFGQSERRRWDSTSPAARPAFVASRALLRELLEAGTGVAGEAWRVSAEAGQAPVATSEDPAAPAMHVSLSHRLGWVAAAVCDTPVGIDLECDRPPRSDPHERALLMLAPEELDHWRLVPADEREDALLAYWTAKEAWFKAAPPPSAPWDFRRVQAGPCEPAGARANVRTWRARPVHLALACANARALATACCEGLPPLDGQGWWRVDAIAPPS